MSQPPASFLFHDYETWGISPQHDYPCQFAAIRTDENLQQCDEPINITAKIHLDYLPHPQAVLVTGITPQMTLAEGEYEYTFMQKIHQAMIQPNTCVVGYNSIKFDDEVSRFSFFRNFMDPYQREYLHGNSRWDLINLVRACYALRPEGIKWPLGDNGLVSFKLERLTQENGISHTNAHDALSDVHATIAIAQLIQQQQPKLFAYAYQLRSKQAVIRILEQHHGQPLIFINPYRSAKFGCVSIIMPICPHPVNKNATVCIDLTKDIFPLINEDLDTLQRIQFLPKAQRNEETPDIATIIIKHNQCPFLAPIKTLSQSRSQALNIDLNKVDQQVEHLKHICQDQESYANLIMTLTQLYSQTYDAEKPATDVEASLYTGGFLNDAEKQFCQQVHMASPNELVNLKGNTPSPRIDELFQRFIARNFLDTLSTDLQSQWYVDCQRRLTNNTQKLTLMRYFEIIEELKSTENLSSTQLYLLEELTKYGKEHPCF